jgi:hypothetical protein
LGLAAAASAVALALLLSASGTLVIGVDRAEARVGRPATPMSYAGVARRTTRRAAAVGAATAAGTAYYHGQACVQVVDAYGRIVVRCN